MNRGTQTTKGALLRLSSFWSTGMYIPTPILAHLTMDPIQEGAMCNVYRPHFFAVTMVPHVDFFCTMITGR